MSCTDVCAFYYTVLSRCTSESWSVGLRQSSPVLLHERSLSQWGKSVSLQLACSSSASPPLYVFLDRDALFSFQGPSLSIFKVHRFCLFVCSKSVCFLKISSFLCICSSCSYKAIAQGLCERLWCYNTGLCAFNHYT